MDDEPGVWDVVGTGRGCGTARRGVAKLAPGTCASGVAGNQQIHVS
jgi:hypothetical protein